MCIRDRVGGLTGAGLGLFSVLGETDGERGVLLAEFLIPVEDAVACGYGLLDEIPTDRLEGVAFGDSRLDLLDPGGDQLRVDLREVDADGRFVLRGLERAVEVAQPRGLLTVQMCIRDR